MRSLAHSISFVLILTLSAHAAEAITLRMKLAWVLNDQYAGQIFAYNKGWYKEKNIDLILMPHQSGTLDSYDSVVTGAADIGVGETLVVLRRAIREKTDIIIFALEDQISPAGFLSLSDRGITQSKDLENHVYGYYNDSDTDLLKWYTSKNGVNYDAIKKVKVIPNDMGPLIRGEVDFIIAHETNEPVILKLNNHHTNFISLSGPKGILFGPSYFCKRSFFEKHRDVLKNLITVTAKGWTTAFSNSREAANLIIGYYSERDYINGSRRTTMDKFITSLGIKKYYLTYKVGSGCICCMSKFYWEMVRERLTSEGLIDSKVDILDYVRFDTARELFKGNL